MNIVDSAWLVSYRRLELTKRLWTKILPSW
jgi:hypothetical protein